MPTCPHCHTGYPDGMAACPRDGVTLLGDGAATATDLGCARVPVASEPSDPLIGSTLAGRFKVLDRIGHGGMGIVYRATHTVIGREVALKVLHERHAERPEVAARLRNEARLASAIRNEHIVDIFDFGETTDGRTFVVMELLEGESLATLIRREGALPEARALGICLQVADALGAAHERHIIHRDVKPENIFVSRRDGQDFVKVLDFGISKAIRDEDGARLTHTGVVLGTPLYMSPEQARGEEAIDHRIDVYALGVIVYECLTGEVPFRGSNYLGIISDVLSRVPVSPRQLRPELAISVGAEQVVARAMARDREARYASMAELAENLRRALRGEPIALREAMPSAPLPPPPHVRARKAMLYSAMAGVALLATVGTLLVARPAPGLGTPLAAPAPAPLPPTPRPPPLPPTVTLQIRTTPPGAEILNGDRRLGVAPAPITLARSEKPVHLSFRLAGYVDGATDVIPAVDDERVDVELKPVPPPPPRRPARKLPPPPRPAVVESNPAVEQPPRAQWPPR